MPQGFQDQTRAVCKGLQLTRPIDLCDDGKFPFLRNVRSYIDGTISPRQGHTLSYLLADAPLHSAVMLLDPLEVQGLRWIWLLGADTSLYRAHSGSQKIDAGYSGLPLSIIPYRPEQSPEVFGYVYDADRMRKVGFDGTVYQIGLAAPTAPPTAALAGSPFTAISLCDSKTSWATGGDATDLTVLTRTIDTIRIILYDDTTTHTGWCSIVPHNLDYSYLESGILVINGESIVVDELRIGAPATTIASIAYDDGTSGLCTLLPTLMATDVVTVDQPEDVPVSTATLTLADQNEALIALGGPQDTTREKVLTARRLVIIQSEAAKALRDMVLVLNGSEYVRVISATVADDYTISLRCKTTTTHHAGELLIGLPSFRCTTTSTHYVNDGIGNSALEATITIPASATTATGTLTYTSALSLGSVGGRAIQPSDVISLAIWIGVPSMLTGGSFAFDVDASVHDFQRSALVFDFSASDLTAILTSGASLGTCYVVTCRVDALRRVGTDTTRTLADVAAARVSFTLKGAAADLTQVAIDSWWIGGTYGLDVGTTGTPYLYRYRPRSTRTGVKGNPSPPTRQGVEPVRQAVLVTPPIYPDTQADVLDIFRVGGALTTWREVGTIPNDGRALIDVLDDQSVAANDTLTFEDDQPWTTTGAPVSGNCTVAGTQVTWLSGDLFDVNWMANTIIEIDGKPYTLYAPPSSTTSLSLNESAGTHGNVLFNIVEPLLAGHPLPAVWGPIDGRLFGVGDVNAAGVCYYTQGNNPDAAPLLNTIEITSPSEPLIVGGNYDGRNFVFSSDRLFVLYPQVDATTGAVTFLSQSTPIQDGAICQTMLAVGPLIFFGNARGIYATDLTTIISLSDADIGTLFTRDGKAPTAAVNGIYPPDFTATGDLRLSYTDGWLYFDYLGINSHRYTLVCDVAAKTWFFDQTAPAAVAHVQDASIVQSLYLLGEDGGLYAVGGFSDAGNAITWIVQPACRNQGDPRRLKRYEDLWLDIDPGDLNSVLQVQLYYDHFVTAGERWTSQLAAGRQAIIYPLASGVGVVSSDAVPSLSGVSSTAAATIYGWSLRGQGDGLTIQAAYVPPTTHGLTGYQILRDLWITYNSTIALTLTITIDGIAYSYTLPISTGGFDQEHYVLVAPVKGLTFSYRLTGAGNFVFYPEDCRVRIYEWGSTQGYVTLKPFAQAFGGRSTP